MVSDTVKYCVLSNRALLLHYGGQPIAFAIACDVWGTDETSLVNDSTRFNQLLALSVLLDGMFSWGTISRLMC